MEDENHECHESLDVESSTISATTTTVAASNSTTLDGSELGTPLIRQRPTSTTSRDRNIHDEGSRILDRDAVFHQSRGRWGIERLSRGRRLHRHCCFRWFWRFREWIKGDWFHRLAYQRTMVLMFILFVIYASLVVFFAFIYLAVSILGKQIEPDPDGGTQTIAFCDMDINDHMEALYFSLSTMTTIGYGVSDYYFGGCWTPLLLVLWQVCTAITFDAVAVGLIFHRISRGRKRGKTIMFSDKAVIRRVQGIPHLMFRIGELRSYHLIEAKVRVYCIRHVRLPVVNSLDNNNQQVEQQSEEATLTSRRSGIDTTHFVTRQVKLLHPNHSLGSHVLMTLPEVIVHRMDEASPLVPRSALWYDVNGVSHRHPFTARYPHRRMDGNPDPHSTDNDGSNNGLFDAEMDSIEQFLRDRDAEIIVMIEGTDAGTGAATQARHSYKPNDLAWNHKYVPCIFPYLRQERPWFSRRRQGMDPVCTIDFERFHDIIEAPMDCETCAYVPNYPSSTDYTD